MPSRLLLVVVLALVGCSQDRTPEASRATEATEPAATPDATRPDPTDEDTLPRVVFLGTSLTAGLGLLREEDTYVARVAELADSAGVPIQVVNAGVSGETSAGGVRRLDWILGGSLDVLVVELGANDGLRGQSPEALEENLVTIIRRTRERHPDARILLAGMEAPPNLGERYVTAFREVFTRVARREDVALVPFLLEDVAGVPDLNQPDGIHPTAEGHRRMARTLWPHLEPLLSPVGADSEGGAGP